MSHGLWDIKNLSDIFHSCCLMSRSVQEDHIAKKDKWIKISRSTHIKFIATIYYCDIMSRLDTVKNNNFVFDNKLKS